jgi:hypothetical protein
MRRENAAGCVTVCVIVCVVVKSDSEDSKFNEDMAMPPRRKKQTDDDIYLKRRSFEEGRALVDAAHTATHRLYCETLAFWRRCPLRTCRRHRRCLGEPTGCLLRGLPFVPQAERLRAQDAVIAGGPRRLAPGSHIEWCLRRTELATVTSWGFGAAPKI